MIATVVREHHWTPDVIDALYLDGEDSSGLEFWYNDVIELIRQIKDKT